MKNQISIEAAESILDRGRRRVYQLIESGDLEAGDFPGTVITASVLLYRRKMDAGKVRGPGRPRNGPSGSKHPLRERRPTKKRKVKR